VNATPGVDTVLLDVDGTLIDSNGAHADAWARAFREHRIEADAGSIRRLIGMGGDKLVPAVAGLAHDSTQGKAIAARKKDLFRALLPGLRPTRGARPLLEFLVSRRVKLAVATSADESEMRDLLDRAGVSDLIRTRASKDDAAESKPDPDIVQAALRTAGASSRSSVLVGDTPYDIEAAARAGVRTVALRCGGHWSDAELSGAIAIFDDPADLLAGWVELFARAEPSRTFRRT
jgi:HAD superfamily hydrolase (TIGR01509 family)